MGCTWRSSGAAQRSDAQAYRQVGRPAAQHPRGRELPLAPAARGRHAAVRVAHALLELPPEARQGPSVLDHTGAAGASYGAVSLDQPAAVSPGAVPAADI